MFALFASPRNFSRPLRGVLMATAAAALVACGSDDDSGSTNPPTTLSGVAAVGSPIAGGTVNVACAAGSPLSTTTGSAGAWTVTTSGQTLPCAVQVQGGTVDGAANTLALHSVAFDYGNVNVTTLTDLVFANAVAANPQTWFASPAFAALTAANVNNAVTQIVNRLGIASALGERDLLTSAFHPQTGDAIDDVLTALGTALQTLGTNFAALLAAAGANNFADFSGLAAAITTAQGGGSSGGTCTAGTQMSFAAGQATGPFTNGQKVCVEANDSSLKIDAKTFSNPTVNTAVTAPYSAYLYTDAGLNYEVIFKSGALYEINIAKVNAASAADFHGQFTVTAGSGGSGSSATLTLQITAAGVASPAITVPNDEPPANQTEFCAEAQNDPNLVSLGYTLTVTSCTFANNVGTINATATVSGFSVPYVVTFTWTD